MQVQKMQPARVTHVKVAGIGKEARVGDKHAERVRGTVQREVPQRVAKASAHLARLVVLGACRRSRVEARCPRTGVRAVKTVI